jgi:KDO2-lipid IV(A) lauroyltransferase
MPWSRRGWWQRVTEAWQAAPSRGVALSYLLQYAGLRVWSLVIGCFSVETNLRTARLLGRIWWSLGHAALRGWAIVGRPLPSPVNQAVTRWLSSLKRHRNRAMDNLRPALGHLYTEPELETIARGSFEHFAQLYLVEMVMTPRLINEWSWSRYVKLHNLGPALRELMGDRGVILLTAHFGNYELLGYTIARLGLPLVAVMRPLDNPLINEFLVSSREAGGISLLYKKRATESADEIIASGGALCFISDQDAGRKGIFADFFGRKASWYKSIGLLAMRRRVPLVVGYAVRQRPGFHYGITVERIIQPEEWDGQDDPLLWITQTFAHALEAGIRRHPEQYLWMHRRWKSRPKEERAVRKPS